MNAPLFVKLKPYNKIFFIFSSKIIDKLKKVC
jgi:hypothetical protein